MLVLVAVVGIVNVLVTIACAAWMTALLRIVQDNTEREE
jgi:hypothetical protein